MKKDRRNFIKRSVSLTAALSIGGHNNAIYGKEGRDEEIARINDPPAPVSHDSPQIMATYEGWKRLLDIVRSPANGMTYDPGVCREMGREFFRIGYTRGIYPEHPRFFSIDAEFPGYVPGRGYPGGGGDTGQVYNVAYTRAMMQAVQSL